MRVVRSRALVDLRVGLLANGRHDHGKPLRPRRVQQQKRKPPVAGDEAKFHGYLITPRSLRSMNATSIATSSPSSAFACFSSACVVFSFDDQQQPEGLLQRLHPLRAETRAAPARSLLIPKALFSRRDEVFENGSTSCVTIVPPPTNAYLPTMQC